MHTLALVCDYIWHSAIHSSNYCRNVHSNILRHGNGSDSKRQCGQNRFYTECCS